MSVKKPVCILDFINSSAVFLKDKNIQDSRLNSELLLCDVLKCDRVNLYLNFDKPLTSKEAQLFRSYIKRRSDNEPLQYITGKAAFYKLEFVVNRNVLIPRPETELLVERIISDISETGKKNVSIFEIGTGSGCIPIALAFELSEKKINSDIFSIDNSEKAINTANENLGKLFQETPSIKFYKKDIFEVSKLTKNFDYIVSNPPYISKSEFNELDADVRLYEPALALTDGKDGMKFFDKIFEITSDIDFKGKTFCEIGFNQREKIEKLLESYGLVSYSFYKDYNDIDRILEIRK